jgi:hypothetical protein
MDRPERAVRLIDGQMGQMVLDVARHPASGFFFDHHSKAHRSPVFFQATSFDRINPTQYPNCAATNPIKQRTRLEPQARERHVQRERKPQPLQRHAGIHRRAQSVAAPAIPGLNARQPNTALPTATINRPPVPQGLRMRL